jgi:D-glycero-D-manno-heptose 1,7-bisphosphate phosphatase
MGQPFVLLDRDGTIIQEKHYLSDPGQVELIEGAAEGLRQLADKGFGLVLITNQSGIGRGYFSERDLMRVHRRLTDLLMIEQVVLQGIYFCPHRPDEQCHCRKPADGMAQVAKRDLDIDFAQSYMVGDKICDIDFGRAVGAKTVLVSTGYGRETGKDQAAHPDFIISGLGELPVIIDDSLSA